MRLVTLVAAVLFSAAGDSAFAQGLGGYLTAGTGSIDYLVARETIPQAGGGVLWRIADDRLRAGVQVDLLTSNGYYTGRGGPVFELAVGPRNSRVRPYLVSGYFFGEGGGLLAAGGGVDVWLNDHVGVRAFFQDAFRRTSVTGYPGAPGAVTLHEPSFQVGFVWR